jgi:hypothetical protein
VTLGARAKVIAHPGSGVCIKLAVIVKNEIVVGEVHKVLEF